LEAEGLYPNWYNNKFEKELNQVKDVSGMVTLLKQYKSDIVILDSQWRSPEQIKIAEASTKLIYNFGRFSVRKVDENLYFSSERLKNPTFVGGDFWNLGPGVDLGENESGIVVSVSSSAMQLVSVEGSTRYRLEMVARCNVGKAQGRLQINWLDKDKNFLLPTIDVFDCTNDWTTYTQDSVSPQNAVYAAVYAASHTAEPIKVKKVSFK
jgi:hypothetical protein